jgi:hypothetical protein
MPNADRDNDDVTTKSNPALTDDCEGQLALSPRAAAAEMARSPIVHVMESAVAVPIDDYKALPVLALDDPDFPNELRAFGRTPGLQWRQCPWNPDVLLAILPCDVGVLVYHRWDGFGVSDDTLRAEQNKMGMMDLRLTWHGADKSGFDQLSLIEMTLTELWRSGLPADSVFSRATIVGEVFTDGRGNQHQEHVGSDLLYAMLLKVDVRRQSWGSFLNVFTEANYTEVHSWGLSSKEQSALGVIRTSCFGYVWLG